MGFLLAALVRPGTEILFDDTQRFISKVVAFFLVLLC